MKFVQLEGVHPLEKPKWEGQYLFPRTLFKVRRFKVIAVWGALGGGCLSHSLVVDVTLPTCPALGPFPWLWRGAWHRM